MLFDRETIELFKKVVEKDGFIQLPAEGNSMFPLIRNNDLCRFELYDPMQLKKGDIILFYSQTSQLVSHRFYYVKKIDDINHFIFKGDSNLGFDQPVKDEQLIGKLTMIEKKCSKVSMNDFSLILWKKLIVTFPMLSGLLRKYINWRLCINYRINR